MPLGLFARPGIQAILPPSGESQLQNADPGAKGSMSSTSSRYADPTPALYGSRRKERWSYPCRDLGSHQGQPEQQSDPLSAPPPRLRPWPQESVRSHPAPVRKSSGNGLNASCSPFTCSVHRTGARARSRGTLPGLLRGARGVPHTVGPLRMNPSTTRATSARICGAR